MVPNCSYDKNHVKSVTDAGNNTVQYEWDTTKDLLKSVTDARGSKITYAYDGAERLTSVSQKVTQGGAERTVENRYTYEEDRLTAIQHHGFAYGFAYDSYGNTKSASIAGSQVVSYEYEPDNGNLKKVTYGNGDSIRYTYDSMDRMALSYYYRAASGTEQKMNQYTYDKQGNLSQVTAHMAGKTYRMAYDFLDRLMRVTDEDNSSYEYTHDANSNMTNLRHVFGTAAQTTLYTYDKDSREVTVKPHTNRTRTITYDSLGRVKKLSWNTAVPFESTYGYFNVDETKRYSLPRVLVNGTARLDYTYDGNGNIASIRDGAGTSTYQYDELNQMIRENNHTLGKTLTYEYDLGGNLLTVKEYAFTTAVTLPGTPEKLQTGTYDAVWKDKLLTWDGTAMTYDAIGNMLTRGSTSYTWTQGRKLASVNNGKAIQYFYDHTGNRTRKVVDGVTTDYRMAGDLMLSEKGSTATQWYSYDSSANLISMTISGTDYFYIRNAQNDIIGLVDENGDVVVNYTYDSWGKVLSITGSLANTIGKRNPFRYRGYYYDTETGMYYLRSRYYNPEIRRFICADALYNNSNLLGHNLYIYCFNNLVSYIDPDGTCPYNGTAADFHRMEQGLPSLDCNCKNTSNIKSNINPRKDKRKGSEDRQKSGNRERNVGHPNGEEHSRVPKGNRITRLEALGGLTITSIAIVILVVDDSTVLGTIDNSAIAPATIVWWDYVEMLLG